MTCLGPYRTSRKPRSLVTDAPCRARRPPAEARLVDGYLGSVQRRQAIAAAFQTRSAFHRRVPSVPPHAVAWNENIAAATDASVWPPRLSFRHAFTRWSRARPSTPTGYSPGLPGHVPLIDFCSCVDPQAQPRPLQTPPLGSVETTARWVASPPGGCVASWALRFRGRIAALAPLRPPRRPPAPAWIYPKPFDPDTSCRSLMPFAVWKTSANGDWPDTSPSDDSFRNPWRISSPGHHGPKTAATL